MSDLFHQIFVEIESAGGGGGIIAVLFVLFTSFVLYILARTLLKPYSSDVHSFVRTNNTKNRNARKLYDPPKGYFLNKDLLYLYFQEWKPTNQVDGNPINGVIFLIHGVGEHIGRYSCLAQTLSNNLNCLVVGSDLQGHGKSEGDRLFVVEFQNYVQDVYQLATSVKAKHGNTPMFLLCHSMGGLIGIRLLEKHPELFTGAVISAPALSVKASSFERKLAPLISQYLPHLPMNKVDPNLLSHDPCTVDLYCNDPLVTTDGVSARLGNELLNTIDEALAFANEITLPYLLIRGSLDQVTLRPGIIQFFESTKSQDKTFTELTDLFHEIFHEKDSPATSIVNQWIQARLVIENNKIKV
jgi:acylglycerol lipase